MKKILAFSILFALLGFGCSQKGEKKVSVKLSLGAITGISGSGGAMLYGENELGANFALSVPLGATSFSKELPDGNWNFFMMSWQGPAPMEGQLRCARSLGNLLDTSTHSSGASIDIILQTANCDAEFVAPAYADATMGVLPLRLTGCAYLQGITAGNSDCSYPLDVIGESRSFRVQMAEFDSTGGVVSPLGSVCISHSNSFHHKKYDPIHFTKLRVPVGGLSPLFKVRVLGFEDPNCAGPAYTYEFGNGVGHSGDLVSGSQFKTMGGLDYKLFSVANPYANPSYPVTQSAESYTFVRYLGASTVTSCTCDAASSPFCSTGNEFAIAGCPKTGMSCTGAGCSSPSAAPRCLSDHSSVNGPNCDAGTFNFKEVACEAVTAPFVCKNASMVVTADTYAYACVENNGVCDASGTSCAAGPDSSDCMTRTACINAMGLWTFTGHHNESFYSPEIPDLTPQTNAGIVECKTIAQNTVTCNGEGAACAFGGSAPAMVSLFIADNQFQTGYSPLDAQLPVIDCNGANCFPNPLAKVDGSGSGSGGDDGGAKRLREELGHVMGTFDGSDPWDNSQTHCYIGSYWGSGSAAGVGGDPCVDFYLPEHDLYGNAPNPNGNNHLEDGIVGEIRSMLHGDGVGGILYREGYTTCASIPTTGGFSITEMDEGALHTYAINFQPGDQTIPTGYDGAGSLFEKKIDILDGAQKIFELQFSCAANLQAGYQLSHHSSVNEDGWREVYYGTVGGLPTLDSRSFYDEPARPSKWKSRMKFSKVSPTSYSLYSTSVSQDFDGYIGSGAGTGERWYGKMFSASGTAAAATILHTSKVINDDITVSKNAVSYLSNIDLEMVGAPGAAGNGKVLDAQYLGTIGGTDPLYIYDTASDSKNLSTAITEINSAYGGAILASFSPYYSGDPAMDVVFAQTAVFHDGRDPNTIIPVAAMGSADLIYISVPSSSTGLYEGIHVFSSTGAEGLIKSYFNDGTNIILGVLVYAGAFTPGSNIGLQGNVNLATIAAATAPTLQVLTLSSGIENVYLNSNVTSAMGASGNVIQIDRLSNQIFVRVYSAAAFAVGDTLSSSGAVVGSVGVFSPDCFSIMTSLYTSACPNVGAAPADIFGVGFAPDNILGLNGASFTW